MQSLSLTCSTVAVLLFSCRETATCLPVEYPDVLVFVEGAALAKSPLGGAGGRGQSAECGPVLTLESGDFRVEMESSSDGEDCFYAADGDGSPRYTVRKVDQGRSETLTVDMSEAPECGPLEVAF